MKSKHAFEIEFCRKVLAGSPDDLQVMMLLADFYTKDGFIAEGLALDQRIVQLLPDNAIAHYNLACSQCLSDQLPEALESLRCALQLGYTDIKWMCEDPDLKNLHGHPDFGALLNIR